MGGALEARGIPAGDGRLRSDATGDIEVEDNLLLLKRIHVTHRLRVDSDDDREAIGRVHEAHASKCPVAQSIAGCIDISTDLELEDG